MKLKINETPVPTIHTNCFVVVVEAMYGDADGYEKVEISGFKKDCELSKKHIESLISTLEEMRAAYPNGRGGDDTYDHVEGFADWFGEKITSIEDWNKLTELERSFYGQAYWPYEHGYDVQASFEDYEVFYYDGAGVKYEVEVIL